MSDLPTVIGPAGLVPQSPTSLLAQLIALVTSVNPGATFNLPGSLVEDISSTDVYAVTLIDQARVELVNCLTPFGANEFLLNQLGQMLGVAQGQETNTSVYCQITGPAGYVIPVGFTFSDGTFQYTVQDGGVINAGGQTPLLFCVATQPGSWAVPANTVTQIVTSYPNTVTLTVTNPDDGIPGAGAETVESYRASVLQANAAEGQGMATYLKTLLLRVSGVQPRLVSVVQQSGGAYMVICGGGDPFQVAYEIYYALFAYPLAVGSQLLVSGISSANPGIVTTNIDHNYSTGQVINIVGVVGMSGINNIPFTITVTGPRAFSIGIDTRALGAYVSGGIVSPSLRNVTATLTDYPNTYDVTFVNPPVQNVSVAVLWNTTSTSFVSSAAVAQLGNQAVVDYVNSIAAGQPINLSEMRTAFAVAVSSVLAAALLTSFSATVSINGVATAPVPTTSIIEGDPQSYFQTQTSQVTISQGP